MRHSDSTTCRIMFLLLLVYSLFYPIMIVSSQSSASVFIEPSTVSTRMGESFNVAVRLSNVENLYGLEVILNWNPSVLQVANVDIRLGVETYSDGVLHESSSSPPIFIAENNLTQSRGEYRLVATSMAPASSFSGSGNIVIITYYAVNMGDSVLDLESQLYDYPPEDRTSLPISHATSDSFVTVNESNLTPTPTSPASSPTLTPTSPTSTPTPTPSSSSDLSELNLKAEHVFLILAIILVIIFLIPLALRRRK